jgi:EthD domain
VVAVLPTTMAKTAGDGLALKQFYLAERHPALSRAEFRASWRRHGELAMRLPLWSHVTRYSQGDVATVPAATRERLPGQTQGADGIACVWFRDFTSVRTMASDPDRDVLLADEDRIFARRTAATSLYTREIVERDLGACMVKLVVFLSRRTNLTREGFVRGWEEDGRELRAPERIQRLVRAYRRHVVLELPGLRVDDSALAGCDGVTEIGFTSLQDLITAVADDGFVGALDGAHRAVAEPTRTTTMITTDLLLYGG